MTRMYVPVPYEFNFTQNLEFLKRSPRELLHRVNGDEVVKVLQWNGEKILISIVEGKNQLVVNFLNVSPTREGRDFIRNYVLEWFDLENDIAPFYELASKDKLLKPLIEKYFGYRIIGQPDLFESIVWAVLGQQINLQFAYTLKQRFVEKFGERLRFNNEDHFLFPSPNIVSGLSDEVLLPLQFSRQKSKYTVLLGKAFASGEISKEKLKGLPLEEAKNLLMKVKGVGNWTANYALMKTFRYKDAFPLEDAGVHNAIKNLKKMDRKPTLEEVKRLFKKYKGWEAYATLYLWKSL
jgi:DNA-3-methyladenine glycosylase II